MKFETKLFFIIILISYSYCQYKDFVKGLSKSFEMKDNQFEECFNDEWKSGKSDNAAKSLGSFKALLPKMASIAEKVKGENVHCQFKNKIKEYWMGVVNKAKDKSAKTKPGNPVKAAPATKGTSFLQRVEKNKSQAKWGVFSTLENDILVLQKQWTDLAKSPLMDNFTKVLDCIGKSQKSDVKQKEHVELFKKGIKSIAVNSQGFVSFAVNFICDTNNFTEAFTSLKKGDTAGSDAEKWAAYGGFVGKVQESFHDVSLAAY
jgi:hypothetical protein